MPLKGGVNVKNGLEILPVFSPDTGSGAGGSQTGGGDNGQTGDEQTDGAKGNPTDNKDNGGKDSGKDDNEYIEKLINARVEKAMEKAAKEKSELEKELNKLRKEKLTAEEVKKLEDEKKAKDLEEREKALKDKENRYFAVGAIKKAGLDDGSDTALKLVDLVMGENEDDINTKISALKELVAKIVDHKVDEKFKAGGRNPNNKGETGADEGEPKNEIAQMLGKSRAEQAKKSKDILSQYLK